MFNPMIQVDGFLKLPASLEQTSMTVAASRRILFGPLPLPLWASSLQLSSGWRVPPAGWFLAETTPPKKNERKTPSNDQEFL